VRTGLREIQAGSASKSRKFARVVRLQVSDTAASLLHL
jgi:hypothetical protein